MIKEEIGSGKKGLSHGPSPGPLAGDPFGVEMETIERKLLQNIIQYVE